MLDDDDRVAGIAQLLQAADQTLVVALVQADGGLVENVKNIDQFGTDLRGEADALALAARERPRRPGEGEIPQPHLEQEPDTLADLLDDLLGDAPLLVAEMLLDLRHPRGELLDGEGRDVGDALAADAELQGLGLEARTAASRAGAVDDELLTPLAAAGRIVVLGAADVLGDALPREELPPAGRRAELGKVDGQRLGIAVEHGVERRLGEGGDGVVEREIVAPPQHFEGGEKHVIAVLSQRLDGALAQGKPPVGNDLGDVEHGLLAQSVAMGAGPLGRIERKGVGRGVLEGDAGGGAHEVARIETLLAGAVVVEGHGALALAHGLPERGHDALAGVVVDGEPVDDQVDGVYLVAVEPHAGRNFANLAVDAGMDITFLGERLEKLAVVALAALDDGREQGDLAAGEPLADQLGDALVGVMHHLLAGDGRIGPRSAGEKQTQEVVDLGDGADRRTGILVGGLLLDGHHGAESRDLVDVGTLHGPDELPGIGREGLHVTALPLGIDGVEGQRRLARTAQSGDDDQLAARDLQIDILEVVHAGTEDFDRIFFHR